MADQLKEALIEYIEATYHIAEPAILDQRRQLLEQLGVVHQAPYLESTPRYQTGEKFRQIKGLHAAALKAFETLSKPNAKGRTLLYDPPYTHQSQAIRETLVNGKNLLITTGTGSGKTESFLMPVLGKFAHEASQKPDVFAGQPGVRAMILYPMNALVNDQLGRLRAIFGDPRLVDQFMTLAGRPPRFARYTSRTPYAGVRRKSKDQERLRPIGKFYVDALERAKEDTEDGETARKLIEELSSRGKWPAKPDLERWYLGPNGRFWQNKNGEFIRAVTLPGDSELITRHEVQAAAPDLLVTNYSMLEYMLMRPIERSIFDQTREWLVRSPQERFLLILDEAHLYRGAGGAEVGLLIRRLRDRLNIPADRLQVICATASFKDADSGKTFAGQLTGTDPASFISVQGDLRLWEGQGVGTITDAELFASVDMEAFYSENPASRLTAIRPILGLRRREPVEGEDPERTLYSALKDYAPLALLVNSTMKQALAVNGLGSLIFPGAEKSLADRAVTTLASLASAARTDPNEPSLLPCRVHTFFRGLRGLWACMDPNCTSIPESQRGGSIGKLYAQPRDLCECNARVLSYFTCRVCGSSYARGYTADPERPDTVWPEQGSELRVAGDEIAELHELDLLLVPPREMSGVEPTTFDLTTGQLNPALESVRERLVFLARERTDSDGGDDEDEDGPYIASKGTFGRCAMCERGSNQGRSPVQDHETKGDQPFQVLVNKQIQVQPPAPQHATKFAPLRGRKVLAFSDSRQVAARLAPYLQMFSARDSLRPLIVRGWRRLSQISNFQLQLRDVYAAVLLSAHELDVRLRPELRDTESFSSYGMVGEQVEQGVLDSDSELKALCVELRSSDIPPRALLIDLISTMRDRSLGLEPLALASIVERTDKAKPVLELPHVPGVTETDEDKIQLARAWLREWSRAGFNLPGFMDITWFEAASDKKIKVTTLTGKFQKFLRRLPNAGAKKIVKEKWLPALLRIFAEDQGGRWRLNGNHLALTLGGQWVRCEDCKSVHRPVRLLHVCLDCGRDSVKPLDPDNDQVFAKRKGFYRRGVLVALTEKPEAPVSLVAAEHTAQLNSAEHDDVFSKAEENELLFQDIQVPIPDRRQAPSAIDVLSSTTTMEVGIDIGQLPAVALRNMPPSRANYQQRAGRAGRRANAIATVVAFGGSDTHDEHFFDKPAEMIAGDVVDPTLTMNNPDIAKRHVRAFLLQRYHQDKIPEVPANANGDLYSVLGKVGDFKSNTGIINRADFEGWLREHETELRARVHGWLPEGDKQLGPAEAQGIVNSMVVDVLRAIDDALMDDEPPPPRGKASQEDEEEDESQFLEAPPEEDDENPQPPKSHSRQLLDTLLAHGVLPRYAFPTDVATFHVFDRTNSTRFRPRLAFAPSQGLNVALSQYAPGKQVWIAGKCYTSGALYTPMGEERYRQWQDKLLHVECSRCGHSYVRAPNVDLGWNQILDCPACNGSETLGPARWWIRPTGFAHPVDQEAVTSPDDIPETSYATRAKLTLPSTSAKWEPITDTLQAFTTRTGLMVSNTGPKRKGYIYCTKCGRIEAVAEPSGMLMRAHPKPYPDELQPECSGMTSSGIVLGTRFPTDVALFSLRLKDPVRLPPADTITKVALRTVAEALARAATDLLEIEPGEVAAEYRPALTADGVDGLETEIFLYDTLSGGAGFSIAAAEKGRDLFQRALDVLRGCKEGCDTSCYRCLRTFRNKVDHASLDRFVGAALLEYILFGKLESFEPRRISAARGLLFTDLLRRQSDGVIATEISADVAFGGVNHDAGIRVQHNGGDVLLVISHPLIHDPLPVDIQLAGIALKAHPVSELWLRQNLARATEATLEYR
ncbi:DEAD/DEAH box helicase [Caenimonas koreensis]|uniref:DEAD/DEAH box helicase n=1 Tax=Caenimonas koreensis TaxID=367474 RepID=UPI002B272C2D|nr:DEAD/DEAH box helicase [Caenimonas koreensis]